MDDPDIKKDLLHDVLRDVNKVNYLLGGNRITIRAMAKLISTHPQENYHILDVGCGDGSMLRKAALYCRKHGIRASLTGIDLSEQALVIAREKSKAFNEICYLRQDILSLPQSNLACDIILCTLTMHHFHSSQIPIFLKSFTEKAAIGVVVNDLQRSGLAYYLFNAFSTIFIRTAMARRDGLISIKSGFTRGELRSFADELGMVRHSIDWKWAFRYLWIMHTEGIKTRDE
jgi:2-polyprenyl-3-methyl-5-hydroxy-6-metoxy-1,4-benzoquinol methylase